MTTTKTRTKPARSCRWMHADPLAAFGRGECVRLLLEIGKEIDVYEVRCISTVDGQAIECWTMSKCDPTNEVEEYTISPDLGLCNCPHSTFRPHGTPCRHRAALGAALARLESEQ